MKIKRSRPLLAGVSLAGSIVLAIALPAGATHDPLQSDDPLAAPLASESNLDSPDAIDPARDYAVGGGQHGAGGVDACSNSDGNCVNEGFAASSGPMGEDPEGHVSATFITPHPNKIRGEVVCLSVAGNDAIILHRLTLSGAYGPAGTLVLLRVIDNGPPVDGMPVDLITNYSPGDFVPLTEPPCAISIPPFARLIRGAIVVHDAMP